MKDVRCSIRDIMGCNRRLDVPFFQRPYVWEEPQWERFLEDMQYITKSKNDYLLGPIILKQQSTPASSRIGDIRTIIDGQQRLTTLTLFFKVLSIKEKQEAHFKGIFQNIITEDPVIAHNYKDREVFSKIVKLKNFEDFNFEEETESNIVKAFKYFHEHVDKKSYDYFPILNSIWFVCIDLRENENEQQIFDTVNSIGVRLTTAELLKNYFFNENTIDLYKENWQNVFERDKETIKYWDNLVTSINQSRSNLDVLLYSFLMIKLQDKTLNVRSEDKDRFGRYENLFDNYKTFIKRYYKNAECHSEDEYKIKLVNELKEYAELFKSNFDSSIVEQELTCEYGLDRINAIIYGLDTTTIIPYFLYVLRNQKDQEEIKKICRIIESFLMKRMICHYPNNSYNNFFSETLIGNSVLTHRQLYDKISTEDDRSKYPNNSDVEKAFHTGKFVNKQAKGILYMIESRIRNSQKQSTTLLGISQYSLEHMMPKKWRNNWGRLSSAEEEGERDRMLLTLGNLTIISGKLNTSISNASWEEKKNGKGNKKGLSTYAGGIEIMSDALQKDVWDEKGIKERAKYLAEKAIEIWNIEDLKSSKN